MRKAYFIITLFISSNLFPGIQAQNIFRFEHFDTEDGLSQNTVSSLLCDEQGFLWIGTMNGLNRFDGYRFKLYKGQQQEDNLFTNNRIIRLWEDEQHFIWMETYDHYYHFLNPKTERISSIPDFIGTSNEEINHPTCFLQYSPDKVVIGTTAKGIYVLQYNPNTDTYDKQLFSDKGRYSISNKNVRFVVADRDSNLWIGTRRGVNYLPRKDLDHHTYNFQHLFIHIAFNSAVTLNDEIWFGTDNDGIVVYNQTQAAYQLINHENNKHITNDEILNVYQHNNLVFVAVKNGGLIVYNDQDKKWNSLNINGKNVINVYFDTFNNAWVATEQIGITRVNLNTLESETYQLTAGSQKAITDLERHVFYEDRDSNLWIGLHGGALAYFDRSNNLFIKYENDPQNVNTISSNIVHCIAEDQSGQMWLGTGQYKGGMERVIKRNPAFKELVPVTPVTQTTDNLVRSTYQDPNGCLWVGTKSGVLHVYNNDLKKVYTFNSLLKNQSDLYSNNIYSIHVDHQKHIWLGSKGQGIYVSNTPLPDDCKQYSQLTFSHYMRNEGDTTSLIGNNVYSITRDHLDNIWIGTFGNGLCKTTANDYKKLSFTHYNTENNQLSNNMVRNIYCDSDSNIWVATSFGLNLLRADSLHNYRPKFQSFFHDPFGSSQVNYNDIVEIFEDSKRQVWFGTFGGGVNKVSLPLGDKLSFGSVTTQNGLSNDVIFGILEDDQDRLWFSSEYGLSRYNQEDETFEIFNESNGLSFNNFSENTCFKLQNGKLIFGGAQGIEMIDPSMILKHQSKNLLELTQFQLFNKDVEVGSPKSPLQNSISYTTALELLFNQSSFSIEYSALDFLDPGKIQYKFILEGFEKEWNLVGNQTKATYTNLKPGKYTFRVRCTDRSGQWNESERQLSLIIHPPWWQTNFAYTVYMLLVIAALIGIRLIIMRFNQYRTELTVEKRVNELKLQFFTNISHEIRTPLTLILGPLEDILQEKGHSDQLKQQLRLMKSNTGRMLELVNELLDFRRIQHNKMQLKVQEIELNAFTRNIYESFIPLARHKHISFEFKAADEPLKIWGDATKFDSIIYNLISNAIKYTPQGKKVVVTVLTDFGQKNALVEVMDQGPGIPNDQISDIFTRFVILSEQSNVSSGIGLSLAQELARLHNGNITLQSKIGEGSTFCFTVPIDKNALFDLPHVSQLEDKEVPAAVEHQQNVIFQDKTDPIPDTDDKKPVILLVEDNEQIATYIASKLNPFYNYHIANNGKEGLKMAETHNPDVIVTDVMMPEMDGIEMTRVLKENFATCHIPVIMLTAKSDIQDQIKGLETGAEAYITKPLNATYLIAVINSQIKQRQLLISKYRDNKNIDPKTLKVNSKDDQFIKELISYIEKNYSTDLTVEHLAQHCCVSRTVFYNKIKGLTGLSPLEFIREIKLKIAHQLLQKGYSVADVAYQIGYSDVKYFSKQFRLMFGYPPSKVKKEFKE